MSGKPKESGRVPPLSFPAALPALTSVRFLLALGVVLFHYHLTWPYDDVAVTGLFERARLGVDAFFILSGFILTHVYDRELVERRFRYGRFIAARVARIFPLHLAGVALVVAMVVAARAMGAAFDPRGYELPALLMTLVLVQAWFPTDQTMLWNGPSWSLSAEWFAYLLFPAFAWVGLVLRRRPAVLVGLAAVVFLLFDWVYRAQFGRILPHAEHSVGILRIAPEFLYGVALYRLGQGLAFGSRVTIGLAAGTTLLVLGLMQIHADDRLIVAVMGPWLLTLALLSKSGLAGVLAARPLTFLGEASFALYLVHIPLLIIWKNAVAELTGKPSAYVMTVPELLGLFTLTIAVACAAHVLIEVPARNLIRRRIDRRPVSVAGPAPSSPA